MKTSIKPIQNNYDFIMQLFFLNFSCFVSPLPRTTYTYVLDLNLDSHKKDRKLCRKQQMEVFCLSNKGWNFSLDSNKGWNYQLHIRTRENTAGEKIHKSPARTISSTLYEKSINKCIESFKKLNFKKVQIKYLIPNAW